MTLQAARAASLRTVLIVASGRSGSIFLHSLFDGHPQVLSYPAVHGLYSPWYSEELVRTPQDAARYLELFTRLAIHFQGRFDEAIGRLGPAGDLNFSVPRREFLALFTEELAGLGAPVSRRKMVLALHTAWGRLRGFDFSRARVLIEHAHNPAYYSAARSDLPGALTLQTVREPVAGYYGMVDFCLKTYGHFKREFFFKFTRDVFLKPWLELAPEAARDPAHHRLVRIEDLNAGGRAAMREIANWVGIEDHDSLEVSTVDGLLCHGNSGRATSITTFSPRASAPTRASSPLERIRLHLLLGDAIARAGYTIQAPRRRMLNPVALLLPLRSELRPRPIGAIRDAIHDARCFDLAGMALALVNRNSPRLRRLLDHLGAERKGSIGYRTLAAGLLCLLIARRLAIDPALYYFLRVRLFLRTYAERTRSGSPQED